MIANFPVGHRLRWRGAQTIDDAVHAGHGRGALERNPLRCHVRDLTFKRKNAVVIGKPDRVVEQIDARLGRQCMANQIELLFGFRAVIHHHQSRVADAAQLSEGCLDSSGAFDRVPRIAGKNHRRKAKPP